MLCNSRCFLAKYIVVKCTAWSLPTFLFSTLLNLYNELFSLYRKSVKLAESCSYFIVYLIEVLCLGD
jgi:hypothetical protein